MPSRLPAGGFAGEGFGIVYMEAGAYGKPVVAGNVGGRARRRRRWRDRACSSTPPTDGCRRSAITRLLLDPELARRLGDGGRGRAHGLRLAAIVERVERSARALAGRAPARLARACRGVRATAREGPLRQPHRRGQRRRALAADAARGAARRGRSAPSPPAGAPGRQEVRALGIPVTTITGTAGSLRLHPLHTPRALAEMGAAALQVRRAPRRHRAEVVHANSIRAGIVLGLAPPSRLPPRSCTCATACRRVR